MVVLLLLLWIFSCFAYNDISTQSSDSISPDTIFFDCSVVGDTILTPGQWNSPTPAFMWDSRIWNADLLVNFVTPDIRWRPSPPGVSMAMTELRQYPALSKLKNYGAAEYHVAGWINASSSRAYHILLKPLGLFDSLTARGGDYYVASATCSLKVKADVVGSRSFYLNRLTRNWTEGTLNGSYGNACWDSAANGVAWTTPGGDYDATIIDSVTIVMSGNSEIAEWAVFDITPYVDSVAAGVADYGFIIRGKYDGSYLYGAFWSDDAEAQSGAYIDRPIITIDMTNGSEENEFFYGVEENDCWHGAYSDTMICEDSVRGVGWWGRCSEFYTCIWASLQDTDLGDYQNYAMIRAYILGEIESPIPDTTELDSIKFYVRIASDLYYDDTDSVYVVSYNPIYAIGDSCSICYSCDYGALGYGGSYCNYYRCGNHQVYGEVIDPSQGSPVTQYGWSVWDVDTSLIDLHTYNVGDTFGLGFVRRHENSPAPTGKNQCSFYSDAGNCPYIVYWYSKPKQEPVSGYINYGLRPPYLRWGLPINQVRRAWGGGRH